MDQLAGAINWEIPQSAKEMNSLAKQRVIREYLLAGSLFIWIAIKNVNDSIENDGLI